MKKVKLGLDSHEEINRLIDDGILFENMKIINVKGVSGLCHRNVADLYTKSPHDFKIVTGYALTTDDGWVQHSWGIQNNNLIESTGNKYNLYYGYILDDDESEDFCFYNY